MAFTKAIRDNGIVSTLTRLKTYAFHGRQSIGGAAMLLMVTFALSAILGFLRSRFLYAEFYRCCAASLDVYNAAFRLPDLIFRLLVSGALTSSFIPIFSSFLHQDQKVAYRLASATISLLLLVFGAASLLLFIFADPLVHAFTPGFTPEQFQILIPATRLLLFAQIFFLASNFLTGIIQTHQVFFVPALAPLVYNLAIIFSIFTLGRFLGIEGVVLGAVIGAFLHLLIQIPVASRLGLKFSFNPDFHVKGVKEIVSLMIPRSLSLGLAEIETTLILFWASSFKTGSISLMTLALQVVYLPSRIFGATVGQASLPELSRFVARKELDKFSEIVTKALLQSVFIAAPITLICLVNRVPIIRLAFGSKNFPWSATIDTAEALAFLSPTIFAQALIQIITRAYYALHDTKTPLYVAAFSLFATVISGSYFSNNTNLGISGLAISVTLGSLVQLIGLCMMLFTNLGTHLPLPYIFKSCLKMFLASSLMGICIWFSMRSLDVYILDTTKTINVILVFIGSTVFGAGVYLFISILLKLEQSNQLVAKCFKR